MRKLNIRMKTLSKNKIKHYVNHDTRIDKTSHIKNNNPNFFYMNNEKVFSFKYDKKDKHNPKIFSQKIHKKITELEELHKTLYTKRYKTNLRTDRTNSINCGVLTFPRDMENDLSGEQFNQQEFIKLGVETIENICKEYKLELVYVSRHFDETTPHFHFMTSNFNVETGEVFKRNAESGKKLQDLTTFKFGKYGFERGVSKEITGLKSSQTEIDKLKNQIKNLTSDNKNLKKHNDDLTTKNTELEEQNKNLLNEITKNKNEFDELTEKLKTLKNDYTKHIEDIETKKETYKNLINPLIKDVNYVKENIDYLIKSEKLGKLTPDFIAKKYVEITTSIKNINETTQSRLFKNLLEKLETPEDKLIRLENELKKVQNKITELSNDFKQIPVEILLKYKTLMNEIRTLKGERPIVWNTKTETELLSTSNLERK